MNAYRIFKAVLLVAAHLVLTVAASVTTLITGLMVYAIMAVPDRPVGILLPLLAGSLAALILLMHRFVRVMRHIRRLGTLDGSTILGTWASIFTVNILGEAIWMGPATPRVAFIILGLITLFSLIALVLQFRATRLALGPPA